jgi:hypothetical protein
VGNRHWLCKGAHFSLGTRCRSIHKSGAPKAILLLSAAEMRLRKIGKPIFPLTKQNVKHNKSPLPKSEIDPVQSTCGIRFFVYELLEESKDGETRSDLA